jgi:two-component system, chemotaxis family, sensor kinase CheA
MPLVGDGTGAMDDLLKEFLTEATESLETLDAELVGLEQNPGEPKRVANIFRQVHTIKGTCGFLGLPRLEAIAHAAEDVLGKCRDGELAISADTVSLILECMDRIKKLLTALEAKGVEPEGDDSDLIERFNGAASGAKLAARPAAASGDSLFAQMGGLGVLDAAVELLIERLAADAQFSEAFKKVDLDRLQGGVRVYFAALLGGPAAGDPPQSLFGFLAARGLDEAALDVAIEHLRHALKTVDVPRRVIGRIVSLIRADRRRAAPSPPPPALPRLAAETAETHQAEADAHPDPTHPANAESAHAAHTIRVNVELLETLMTTVSELVLTRNQLLRILRTEEGSPFATPLQRLNHVTAELQEGVMRARLQPIGNAWTKLPRLVRDLARELSKKIRLEMTGAETELDRQVLEIIKDPLTHMVRNSADHGLEKPKERAAAGKAETGTIRLRAYHEGGHIVIAVSDDGRGIPIEKIKAKAAALGLLPEAELAGMSEQQAMQLIFRPGFTTAEAVTSVSGRGVGMDVVRSNIERIGGTIETKSIAGAGTAFTIRIPLTLAIVPALLVEAAGERFAIPQINVSELVHAFPDSDRRIERIDNTPVLRLRDRLLPLVSLAGLLGIAQESTREDAFIVVTQVGATVFGIMVDELFDTEEIVVKPMPPILRDIQVYSGNTILGDGSVVMILDPNGIASAAGELIVERPLKTVEATEQGARDDRRALLLFRAADRTPKAVPLAHVARLEEFAVESIERSGGWPVVQYRGRLMPLVTLHGAQKLKESGHQPVIVLAEGKTHVGLAVDDIVDIVEERLNIELDGARPGVVGSAVIVGRATEIIDHRYYVTKARSAWQVPDGSSDAEPELALEIGGNVTKFDPDAPRRTRSESLAQGAA